MESALAGVPLGTLQAAMAAIIVLVAFVSGFPALKRKWGGEALGTGSWGDAFAAGVFLGAGLIHMLGDAEGGFEGAGIDYPYAMVLCGMVVLALLWVEHLGNEMEEHASGESKTVPVLAAVMLSVHSFLAGAALGTSSAVAVTLVLFLAVMAHKSAASYALARRLAESAMGRRAVLITFAVFVAMFPAGVALGEAAQVFSGEYPLIEPVFLSLAAGTFLYLGTLHGLAASPMIARCCNRNEFSAAVLGFALMALVAIWT